MRARRTLCLSALLVLLSVLTAPGAHAQAVSLTTPYPSIDVEAGGSVSLNLHVHSSVRQRVDLEVVDFPDGWTATLRGGGFVIGSVTADPDDPPKVTLDVNVPVDASQGSHQLAVTATGQGGGSDRLDIQLRVAAEVVGAVSLATDFPRLTGGAEDTFRWNVTLRNDVPEDITFALQATGPEGWQVEAHPSREARATTLTVEGGSDATVNVEATPPDNVEAGDYRIVVEAVSPGRQASLELVAEVVGSVQVTLRTSNERLNATGTAGRVTEIELLVINDGSAPLVGVSLAATPPSGWTVEFDPDSVDLVPPGQRAPVTARVTPSEEAVAGDYVVTLRAEGQGRSSTADIRFTVETSPAWGGVGLAVILGALGTLALVFRRFGRR